MISSWILPREDASLQARAIARELSLPMALAGVLVARGFTEPGAALAYFDPKLRELSAPEELEGISEAVGRVDRALRAGERIVLYGDYDVDGVASLAFLSRILRAYGARVACFLPLRAEEGYGLSLAGVERCWKEHTPALVIAVDCGTNSVREVERLRALGADTIILDHHEPSGPLPEAILVNPKVSHNPLRYLCSAGVVFKLVHALLKHSPHAGIDVREYLDLVTVATIADLVALVGENRILARRGLYQLTRSCWPGLRALMRIADVRHLARGADIGFRLGPRLNASGRLGAADVSLRLLETDDEAEATRLAASLDRSNRERQGIERVVASEAEAMALETFDAAYSASIVVGSRNWHQGVLGIVAARLMRRHHRPAVVVGFDSDGMGRGSGRSIAGFSLVGALARCSDLLERFGGHDLAAGLCIQEGSFAEFRSTFEAVAQAGGAARLTPSLHLDAELPLGEINHDLLDAQDRLEPFGNGNEHPVFFVRAVTPSQAPRVLKEKHLQVTFESGAGSVKAIFFNGASEATPRPPWDVAFRVERNTYRGRNEPQLQIVALRSAA